MVTIWPYHSNRVWYMMCVLVPEAFRVFLCSLRASSCPERWGGLADVNLEVCRTCVTCKNVAGRWFPTILPHVNSSLFIISRITWPYLTYLRDLFEVFIWNRPISEVHGFSFSIWGWRRSSWRINLVPRHRNWSGSSSISWQRCLCHRRDSSLRPLDLGERETNSWGIPPPDNDNNNDNNKW